MTETTLLEEYESYEGTYRLASLPSGDLKGILFTLISDMRLRPAFGGLWEQLNRASKEDWLQRWLKAVSHAREEPA